MIDYAAMSYDELRRIAENEALAEKMSDEEYEALSIQLWRKFGVEQGIRDHRESFVTSSHSPKEPSVLRWFLKRLVSGRAVQTDNISAQSSDVRPSSPPLRELSRSGD